MACLSVLMRARGTCAPAIIALNQSNTRLQSAADAFHHQLDHIGELVTAADRAVNFVIARRAGAGWFTTLTQDTHTYEHTRCTPTITPTITAHNTRGANAWGARRAEDDFHVTAMNQQETLNARRLKKARDDLDGAGV
jgi:hypothetical protein